MPHAKRKSSYSKGDIGERCAHRDGLVSGSPGLGHHNRPNRLKLAFGKAAVYQRPSGCKFERP
jgi:hypothetical protein